MADISQRLSLPTLQQVRFAGFIALAYFPVAAASIAAFGTNTPLWFANAVAVAGLLRQDGRGWPISLIFIWIVDAIAVAAFGSGPALLIGVADVLEVLLAATAIRRTGGVQAALSGGRELARLIVICLLAPIPSSAWGAGVLSVAEGAPFLDGWRQWYTAAALGLLLVGPFLLSWTTPELRERISPRDVSRALLLTGGLALVGVVAFSFGTGALLFATFPALLLVVWSSGLLGATTGAMTLACIGLWFTLSGEGAIVKLVLPVTDIVARIGALQLYLVAVVLTSLPLAVVLANQRALAAQLARAAQARGDFLAAMSHEIRTPMTGVLGMVDLLVLEELTPRQRNYLESIRASGRHLLNIINDILDFSRIETGSIQLEHIDFSLPEALERLRSLMHPLARERGLELRFEGTEDVTPVIKGDPTRLKQVLLNLVGNAIKFTSRGSVTVAVSERAGASGPRFRFEVRDTGIGIPADSQAELFSAFSQADRSTTRRYGGSGLGLAISKRLVEAMGGEIGVSSVPDAGSIFWFEIPFEAGDQLNLPQAHSSAEATVEPRRILVAEDVELNREILKGMLEGDGHQISFAENGAEAVELIQRAPFDVVLMDVQMPVMDGVEATRRIRNLSGPVREIPIIALTANVMAAEQEKYLAAGMNDCLTKPVDWNRMRTVISRYRPSTGGSDPEAVVQADPPLFDIEALERLRGSAAGNQLASWLTRILEDAETFLDAARTSSLGRNELVEEAHKLKGTAANLGLRGISNAGSAIEAAAKEDSSVEPVLAELERAVAATRTALRERKWLS